MTNNTSAPELYRLIEEEKWVKAVQRVSAKPGEAHHVDPETKFTALHLAVRARSAGSTRIATIRALLQAHPEAATVRDEKYGYSPLAYACLITDDSSQTLEDDLHVVEVILEYAPMSIATRCRNDLSSLDLHVMALSRLKRNSTSSKRSKKSKTHSLFAILKALLKHEESVASIAKTLDLLFECNSFEVLEQMALEEAQATTVKLCARRLARSSGASTMTPGNLSAAYTTTSTTNLTGLWVWEVALLLLHADHTHQFASSKPAPGFNAVHAAARVKDCPLPFLILAMRSSPIQVRTADAETGNYPVHFVAGWDISDHSSVSRKSMALSALISEYPQATKIRNKIGKTPLSLALETGTTWDQGVRRLTSFRKETSFSSRSQARSYTSLSR